MKHNFIDHWKLYLILPFCLLLSLFFPFEPGGESWGYWAFSRITIDSGLFVTTDRSPLYTLYLIPFHLFEYPLSVSLEYLVTTSIVLIAIILFSKRYIGIHWAILFCFLWLPFIQISEPPVQKLALACSLFAIILRQNTNRNKLSWSYTLFLMAYMFRSTYIIFLLLFIFWDLYLFYLKNNKSLFIKKLFPRFSDLPLFLVVSLFITFIFFQSAHVWNNAQFANTIWFPGADGLINASFIQSFNILFIIEKYSEFTFKDFYFTNQELFNGAETIWTAIKENPSFVISQVFQNAFIIIKGIIDFVGFVPFTKVDSIFIFILALWGLVMVILKVKDNELNIFIIGNVLMLGALVLTLPKSRYFFPLIPLFIISTGWIVRNLKQFLSEKKIKPHYKKLILGFNTFIVLALLSPSVSSAWVGNALSLAKNISSNSTILEKPKSIKPHVSKIESLLHTCKGVMALENTFLAAFSSIPLEHIVDIWEIPPFGFYKKNISSYDGLIPERIDCLLISEGLSTGVGLGTNSKLRYQNYILPYISFLDELGAERVELKNFGYIVVLKKYKND